MSQPGSRQGNSGATSRRGPQKAHIPYRGDDLEHGKKTGKTVNQVLRDADDFEPFEQVLDQAYRGSNGPRSANNRTTKAMNGHSRQGKSFVQDDFYDSGEVSMDIDSAHNSPSVYFNNATTPPSPSVRRVGLLSRLPSRGSLVDYDSVPSPMPVSRRTSLLSGTTRPKPRSSRLQQEVPIEDTLRGPVVNQDNNTFAPVGVGDDHGVIESPDNDSPEISPNSRGNLSFTALAQEDDDYASQYDQSPSSTRTDKGKGRAKSQDFSDEDVSVEQEIAGGLQPTDETDGEGQAEPGPSEKRPRRDGNRPLSNHKPPKKKTKRSQPSRTKKQSRFSIDETPNQHGLRRSKRRCYPPLEYWRQERVVWGRRENGRSFVPVIKEIITIPKPQPEPLRSNKRKLGGSSKGKRTVSPNQPVEEVHVIEVDNPELGWDDNTSCNGIILDWYSKQEVERRVAYTAKMISPKIAQASTYSFQKVFGDGNFIAAGQLVIPAGDEKPTKPAKDNTYIFYIIEGAVECKVHRSSFVLATGGMFMVPRGNQYYIKNICERDVKIFFAQARKIEEAPLEVMPDILSRASAPPRARTLPHTSSQSGSPSKQSLSIHPEGKK